MTQIEVRQNATKNAEGKHEYEGQTAEQWREIARERDYEQRYSADEWKIVSALEDLDEREEGEKILRLEGAQPN